MQFEDGSPDHWGRFERVSITLEAGFDFVPVGASNVRQGDVYRLRDGAELEILCIVSDEHARWAAVSRRSVRRDPEEVLQEQRDAWL